MSQNNFIPPTKPPTTAPSSSNGGVTLRATTSRNGFGFARPFTTSNNNNITSGKLAVSREVVSRQWSFLTQQQQPFTSSALRNNINNNNFFSSHHHHHHHHHQSTFRSNKTSMISSSSLRLSTAQAHQVLNRLTSATSTSRNNISAESQNNNNDNNNNNNNKQFHFASWFSNFDENVGKMLSTKNSKEEENEVEKKNVFSSIPFADAEDVGGKTKTWDLHCEQDGGDDYENRENLNATTTSTTMISTSMMEKNSPSFKLTDKNSLAHHAHHLTVLQHRLKIEDDDEAKMLSQISRKDNEDDELLLLQHNRNNNKPYNDHHRQNEKSSGSKKSSEKISNFSSPSFGSRSPQSDNDDDEEDDVSGRKQNERSRSASPDMPVQHHHHHQIQRSTNNDNSTPTSTTRSSRKAQREKRIAQIQEKFDERQNHFLHGACNGVAISSSSLGGSWVTPNPIRPGTKPEPISIDLESVSMAGEMLIPKISEKQQQKSEDLNGKWIDIVHPSSTSGNANDDEDDGDKKIRAHHFSLRFDHMPTPNLRVKLPYRPTNSDHLSSGAGGSSASASSASPFTTSLRKAVQKYKFVDKQEEEEEEHEDDAVVGGEHQQQLQNGSFTASFATSSSIDAAVTKNNINDASTTQLFSSASSTSSPLLASSGTLNPSTEAKKQEQAQLGKSFKNASVKLVKFKDQLEQSPSPPAPIMENSQDSPPSSPLASTLNNNNNNNNMASPPCSPSSSSSSPKVFSSPSFFKKLQQDENQNSSSSPPNSEGKNSVGPKSVGWKKLRSLTSIGLTKDLKSSQSPTRPTKDRSNVGIGKAMTDFDRKMEAAEQRIHGESVAEIARRKLHAHVQKFVSLLEDIRDECGFESGTVECAKLEQVGEALRIRHISLLYESLHEDGKELISPLTELDAATSDPELLRALKHEKTMRKEEVNWRTALGGAYSGTAHISSNTTPWSALPGINHVYRQPPVPSSQPEKRTENNQKTENNNDDDEDAIIPLSSTMPEVNKTNLFTPAPPPPPQQGKDVEVRQKSPTTNGKKSNVVETQASKELANPEDDDDDGTSVCSSTSSDDEDGTRAAVRQLQKEKEEKIIRDKNSRNGSINILTGAITSTGEVPNETTTTFNIPPIVISSTNNNNNDDHLIHDFDHHHHHHHHHHDHYFNSSALVVPVSTSVFTDARQNSIEAVRPRKLLFVESKYLVDRSIQSGNDIEEPEVMCRLAEMHMKALGTAPSSVFKRKSARVLI